MFGLKLKMKYIITLIAGLVCVRSMCAAEIPALPADPAVKTGVLPNGLTYYAVSNPLLKGVADFALVQKVGTENIEDAEVPYNAVRTMLQSRPRQLSRSVREYFAGIGVIPGQDGFAQVRGDATVLRLSDVNIAQNASVLDSTLMVLVGMTDFAGTSGDTAARKWYAPSDQAIIISGDIDASKVAEKLRILSYMVPSSVSMPRKAYKWVESDTMTVSVVRDTSVRLATIRAFWKLQRTPKEYMNTVQPLVLERYMSQFGMIVCRRLKDVFRASGVPVAEVGSDYIEGTGSVSDEGFEVYVTLSPEHVMDGAKMLAGAVSSLSCGQVTYNELVCSGYGYADHLRSLHSDIREHNSEYVDRCISSFLYNASLSSPKEKLSFHTSRSIQEQTEIDIFNSIASSSVDVNRNLTLSCVSPQEVPADSLEAAFETAWKDTMVAHESMRAVPSLQGMPEIPVKIRSAKTEPLSGGTVLTLSNGMKVIYRKMATKDEIYYSLVLNGGYGSVADIQPGEGAYLSDCMEFCRIGGVDSKTFLEEARKRGFTMKYEAGFSNVRFSGKTPDDGLEHLMRVLLTVMNDTKTDEDAFRYYMECERLSLECGGIKERIAVIDSIMCPDYRYSVCKAQGRLSEGLLPKAGIFMENHARKVNDGILILVGDIDERQLKKVLKEYASGFRTEDRVFSRPVVSYQPISGTVVHTSVGPVSRVDVAMSVPMALTADNRYAADIAAMALRNELARVTAETGVGLRVNHNCRKHPQERFNMMVSLVSDQDAELLCRMIRETLEHMSALDISDRELSSYKSLLHAYLAHGQETPEYWVDAIAKRYFDGKDFTTGAKAKIDAVTKDKIKMLLSDLTHASRVEYITEKQ